MLKAGHLIHYLFMTVKIFKSYYRNIVFLPPTFIYYSICILEIINLTGSVCNTPKEPFSYVKNQETNLSPK